MQHRHHHQYQYICNIKTATTTTTTSIIIIFLRDYTCLPPHHHIMCTPLYNTHTLMHRKNQKKLTYTSHINCYLMLKISEKSLVALYVCVMCYISHHRQTKKIGNVLNKENACQRLVKNIQAVFLLV